MSRPSYVTSSSLVCVAVLASAVTVGGCKRLPKDKADKAQGDTPAATTPAGSGKPAGGTKIGVVFDVGGLGDKSFNDSANRGLQKAKAELAVQTQYIEPGD